MLGLSLAGVALRAHDNTALSTARDAAHTARVALEQANVRAAYAESVAANADARAQQAAVLELRAKRHADSVNTNLSVLRERYRVASAVVPDTCRPIKAAADSALAASDSLSASLRAALTAADDRASHLQVGLDTTRDALAKLRSASVAAVIATARFEDAAKPNVLSRILKFAAPRVGFGVGAGLDTHGRPNLITGITVGWSF